MDFDLAAKRLDRDHSRLKRDAAARQQERKGSGRARGVELSSQARKEAEELRRQAQRKAEEKQARVREHDYQLEVFRSFERSLKVRSLTSAPVSSGSVGGYLPTSIHGEGDKLALPPSVLEHLSSAMTDNASPWTFRVGMLNPEYAFPASPLVRSMKPPPLDGAMMEDEDDDSNEDDQDDDDEANRNAQSAAYLDELKHKYLAYTHGTVVEFTQDEGQVGLPRTIASALLAQVNAKNALVRVKRTVDPATRSDSTATDMDVDRGETGSNDAEEERTAGHLAWGAFDVPDMPVEVSLVELPRGTGCTLAPTPQAIANGFYNLADVKLVLEQSLIRTRATLTVGDLVHTWNRGVQYDLHVTSVLPSTYNAVVCINTDIEVDFAPVPSSASSDAKSLRAAPPAIGGRTLMDGKPHPSPTSSSPPMFPASSLRATTASQRRAADLRPEPPADRAEGVCVIQVRYEQLSAKRRFDVNEARVSDVYDFAAASALFGDADGNVPPFRLVTRYPRRIIEPASAGTDEDQILANAGIKAGQELLIVERL